MTWNFNNANNVFEEFYGDILNYGIPFDGTKALFNIGFTINNPSDNKITVPFREWREDYAEAEWQWYLTGDPSAEKLGEIYGTVPKIWERMTDSAGDVRSNYGWQWERNNQLEKVIEKLKTKPDTRQAVITVYDGKEMGWFYKYDTPCTTAIQFSIVKNKLNMCVTMRSNDLWFGFCNDQYCFSMLQKLIADRLSIELGSYYHFAHNLHLYERDWDRKNKFKETKIEGFLQQRANYFK